MSMDDLFKSVSLFRDGVQQLAITAGVKNAADQVQQVNMSMNDELEKRKAQGQIAQQLGMQLSAIGAPVSQIQQAVGTIAPPQIKNANDAYNQALQTGDQGMLKMAKDMQGFETKPTLDVQNDAQSHDAWQAQLNRDNQLAISRQKGELRLAEHELKEVGKITTQFESAAKGSIEAYTKSNTALQMLNSDNPVADKAVLNFLVKTTGDTGAITDSDRAAFAGSPQAFDALRRTLQQKVVDGKLDATSRQQLVGLATLLRNKSQSDVDTHVNRFAKVAGARLGVDPQQLKPKIFGGFDNVDTAAQKQQASDGRPSHVPANFILKTAKNGKKFYVNPANPSQGYPAE